VINKVLKLTKLCANLILENGGETYRAEDCVMHLCRSLGFEDFDVSATPTGVMISVCDSSGVYHSVIGRVLSRTVNLTKIDTVNSISRGIISGNITVDDGIAGLEALTKPEKSKWFFPIFPGLSSGFFTALFGGSIFDFGAALFCGVTVSYITRLLFRGNNMHSFFNNTISGMIITLFALISARIFGMGSADKIILGSMMPLFPGLLMVNAIRDSISGDLLSGGARALESLISAASLAIGAAVILNLWSIIL